MLNQINRNLLKYSAGRAITCPHCGQIADCRRWVLATQGDTTRGACTACWDAATAEKTVPASVEVLDGRVIFRGRHG